MVITPMVITPMVITPMMKRLEKKKDMFGKIAWEKTSRRGL
jgi:hypothetical protein